MYFYKPKVKINGHLRIVKYMRGNHFAKHKKHIFEDRGTGNENHLQSVTHIKVPIKTFIRQGLF